MLQLSNGKGCTPAAAQPLFDCLTAELTRAVSSEGGALLVLSLAEGAASEFSGRPLPRTLALSTRHGVAAAVAAALGMQSQEPRAARAYVAASEVEATEELCAVLTAANTEAEAGCEEVEPEHITSQARLFALAPQPPALTDRTLLLPDLSVHKDTYTDPCC